MTLTFEVEPIDTMAPFLEKPQWRPRIVTRFGPRLVYIAEDGSQKALALSEADLWDLGREVAEALVALRSAPGTTAA